MFKLHRYFYGGAVLQRNAPVCVSGFSDSSVTVTLSGGEYFETRTAECGGGKFSACFLPVTDTESKFTLTAVSGEESISVTVRFGDVYLMMGQSNMSYVLSATEDYEVWVNRAANADISVLDLVEPPFSSLEEVTRPAFPLEDLRYDYKWTKGKDENISGVSALSVITAAKLYEKNKIPVGIVNTSMGGLSIEAYMKRETVEADAESVDFLKEVGRYHSVENYNTAGGRNFSQLSGVWNEKISPILNFKFTGIVWYLGESSAWNFRFAQMFKKQLKMFLGDIKESFGELPFIAVHIAPEYYPGGDGFGYLYINEALTDLQNECTGVCSLPIYDIEPRWLKPNGDLYFHPIHPVNKAPVAERIAAALSGEYTDYPRISQVIYGKGKAVCTVTKQLKSGKVNGFTLCGSDGKYYPAEAYVNGKTIEVSSADVKEPTALTFAFTQYQDFCNAVDLSGAPLLPYRSLNEPVSSKYCFTPAFCISGASQVYENNFGCAVGTCRKVEIWRLGEIYGTSTANINVLPDCVKVSAQPKKEEFCLFGISPVICLAGHHNHLGDYNYLKFKLAAEGNAEFMGVIVRAADGNVYRYELKNGDISADSLPVTDNYCNYSVDLTKGLRGDSFPMDFDSNLRKSFIQMEFLFRAKESVTVYLKEFMLSDINMSLAVEKRADDEPLRGDLNLPQN